MTDQIEAIGGNAAGRLKSFAERLDRLLDDRAAVNNDMKEVRAEAKGEGFDPVTLNKIVALMRKDKAKVQESNAILQLYAVALGVDDLI